MGKNKIREIRKSQGISQTRLSISAGVAQGCLSLIENGKLSPWPKVKRALAKALGVKESALFSEANGGTTRR